jgi:hypothetical protein
MTKPNLSWQEKGALIALLLLIITNPLTGQYVASGVLYVFDWLIGQGAYINLVATAYLVAYMLYRHLKATKLNVPKKHHTTKQQKYLD